MHTLASVRGRGFGRRLLLHILSEAKRRAYLRLSLETGDVHGFEPARKLSAAYGFTYCGPFGDYALDPHSVFITLVL